ncbi:hypothetical protein T484DRAFT_1948554 [Baffinella frigidus]|nr:hypothetical protein T484DRAFT_1948554 [Cryptophyta sp. CCMP2293]
MVSDGVRQEGLALMVCDCNNDSRDTARDLVLPLAHLCSPGAPLIFTVKLPRRASKGAVAGHRVQACIDILSESFEGFQSEWLFANSALERTIIAYRRAHLLKTSTPQDVYDSSSQK